MVRADTLTAPAILGGIRRGDFYASTGVTLRELSITPRGIRLSIARPANDDRQFTTEFIGRGGRVLSTVRGMDAEYAVKGDEGYVRARVFDSNGRRAWTQAVMLKR